MGVRSVVDTLSQRALASNLGVSTAEAKQLPRSSTFAAIQLRHSMSAAQHAFRLRYAVQVEACVMQAGPKNTRQADLSGGFQKFVAK